MVSESNQECTVYEFGNLKPGFVTIINVEEFDQSREPQSNRKGSEMDVKELCETFKSIEMEVNLMKNPTKDTIMELLESDGKEYSKYAMSVFIIMSHGNKDEVYATDGRIKINDIVKKIQSKNELKNKPKIFIFQACRGSSTNRPENSPAADCADVVSLTETDATQPPNFADCCVIHSTIEGHVAYRDITAGSWFIQDWCQVVKEFSRQDDITELMTKVTARLSQRQVGGDKQICPSTFTLTKKLFLTKEAYEKYVRCESAILLLGSPGVGKSTLGNLILREKVFTSCSRMKNGITDVKRETRLIDGKHNVQVIDTPGIDFKKGCDKTFAKQFKEICVRINSGINAFVFVLPYGKRLTEHELCVLQMLRKMFGDQYFYKYGLLVFTRGDDFETDDNTEGKTWQQWLTSLPEKSMEKKIMSYFENAPLLINNRTRDEDIKREQSRCLINVVERVSQTDRYGITQFEEVNDWFHWWRNFEDYLTKLWKTFAEIFSNYKQNTSYLKDKNPKVVIHLSFH
ncbi:uncharacterized protein LOC131941434 [Physella acuta]|uniref:uncharacterized protein LOC131941434 n=1 Tax=Physella acuta TaxID=109671 RepID=UPI0027DBEF86|nr:uncharacterized protein LOC131941434 [Physella acuta]XP_059156671.1 uncharacterized protein LOC131941434 [Physella acuta]